jgi:SAM-dependent methyltransferase
MDMTKFEENLPDLYERSVVPRYEPIAEEVARRAAVTEDEHVLEVGAGTGLLTRSLLTAKCYLIVTDISSGMLGRARKSILEAGLESPPMLLASVDALPFAEQKFDVIAASLTPVQDNMKSLREAYRVLRQGGRICFSMWGPSYSEVRIANHVLRLMGKKNLPYAGPGRAVNRMNRAGFDVCREDCKYRVEFKGVPAYLKYRQAFGLPTNWSAAERSEYYSTVAAVLYRRSGKGVVELDWTITYITAIRT